MRYVQEYRQKELVQTLGLAIHDLVTRPWTLMEVCGGQTHTIAKFGLESLLPPSLRLLHGPGCPVCVTPLSFIDHAIEIGRKPHTILCSFGDMLRVPGSNSSLLALKAQGSDVRIISSPLDAIAIAKEHPSCEVVLFAVGFETTAPTHAMAVHLAKEQSLSNFSLLASHVLVPPALRFLLEDPASEVDGFLAAGHVCTVTGYEEYHALAHHHRVPIVVTGFEPVDILQGIYLCVEQLEKGTFLVQNQYTRSVRHEGNPHAKTLVERVFEVVDRDWRGLGILPKSGLGLRSSYAEYDAALRFPFTSTPPLETHCQSGKILQGKKKPQECPLFGKECRPETPVGAPMVSTEGACSAYYHYLHSAKP